MKKNRYRVCFDKNQYRLLDKHGHRVEEVDRFFASLEARGLSFATIRSYAYDLLVLYRWSEKYGKCIKEIDQSDLLEFLSSEQKRKAHPRSINRRLLVCNLLFRFCTGHEIPTAPGICLPVSYYRGSLRDRRLGLHRIKKKPSTMLMVKVPKTIVEPLSKQQVAAIFQTLRRYRDTSIVYLMLFCGLRSREVLSMRMGDVFFEERRIRVRGKGRKERMVPLPDVLAASLNDYLRLERPRISKNKTLFLVMQGKRRGMPMTPAGLRSLFRHRRLRNRTIKNANPHRFRHTFGTDMARSGMGLPILRELMGHADHETTLQYINLSMVDIRREYEQAVKQIETDYDTDDIE